LQPAFWTLLELDQVLKKLDHVGIVVKDIQQACLPYESLGLKVSHSQGIQGKPVTVAFLPLGDTELELLQPNPGDSNIARFLSEHGEGLHHICFEVDDLEEAIQAANQAGMTFLDPAPRQGASGRIIFLDPGSSHGVLIELVEK
jgi:methylmalonyl-CoA/ethylmalonyl-CoA epimerase